MILLMIPPQKRHDTCQNLVDPDHQIFDLMAKDALDG